MPSTLGRVIHNLLYGTGDTGSLLTRFVRV
jgi:hypothetical protein